MAEVSQALEGVLSGGDVNVTDSDGDTPLYTVENIETARFLVEHGAIVDRRNNEGISVCFYYTVVYIGLTRQIEANRTLDRRLRRSCKLSSIYARIIFT
jgi:hypothetical protein